MLRLSALEGRTAPLVASAVPTAQAAVPTYPRHVSERTLPYGLVQAHYPDLMARLTAQDRSLPASGVDRAHAPSFAQLTLLAGKIAHRACRHLVRNGWLEGEDESVFLSDRAGCDDGLDALRMSSITNRIATGAQAGRVVTSLQTIPADTDAPEGDADKIGGFSLHAGVAAEAYEGQKLERLCRYIARPAISEKRLSISPQGKLRYRIKTPWKNGTTHVEFEPVELMARIHARHPAGDLRSSKSEILPICHRQTGGTGAATARASHPVPRRLYSGHPALRPPGHPTAVQIRAGRICAPNAKLRAQLTPPGRGKRPPSGRGIDWGRQRPPQPRRKAPLDDLKRSASGASSTSTRAPASTAAARCGSWPASKNPPPSAPSSPTSKSMARGRKRTTDPPRAHRPPWPRDIPPATKPVLSTVEGPKAKPGRQHGAAKIPQGSARPAVGNRREMAANGASRTPINPPKRSQTLCDDALITPKPSLR